MMDEPMASLDSSRRQVLIKVLTQDKNFKQIFLITHTDIDFGDYHLISVDENEDGARKVEFRPIEF
jgi:ABC-type transport system involved in cytochrome bd biosynthesis fused ATPase/permease subunit